VRQAIEPHSKHSPVEAVLNYLAPMREKPRRLAYEPPPGVPRTNFGYDARAVSIHDLRASTEAPSLDRQGFELVRHGSVVRDFHDGDHLRGVYYPEAERLIGSATGGDCVVIFDHTVRRRIPGVDDRAKGAPRQPVTAVHNDYTASSGPQRLRDFLTQDDRLRARSDWRFSIVNLWRPMRGPLRDTPLAVCDARSVTAGDLVPADLVYPDRTGENYLVTHSHGHRWSYVSDMTTEEALLFRCYDSATDGRARFTPHASFIHPGTPPGDPPRESIELRAFVFYDA
jgi:hypothetical protein